MTYLFSRLINVVALSELHSLLELYNIPLYIDTIFYLSLDGCFALFQLLAIVNSTGMNIGVQIWV